MRRIVVVQPYAKVIVHSDVILLGADSFRSSVPQEDMRRTRVRARPGRSSHRRAFCRRIPHKRASYRSAPYRCILDGRVDSAKSQIM